MSALKNHILHIEEISDDLCKRNEEAISCAGAALTEVTKESDFAPICVLKSKSKPVEMPGFFPI